MEWHHAEAELRRACQNYIALAQESATDPVKAQALRLKAVTLGRLAVAHEVRELRESVS
ncbi:hypothetical protein ACGFIH_26735 [Micromonospora parva]